jgi:CBS domain-containing protein
MHVKDYMTTTVQMTSPQQPISKAAATMKQTDTGALPVGENDRLVGMITDRDIAIRAVAAGRGGDTPVRDVMTSDLHYVFEDDELSVATQKMGDLKLRRLPVLNREKQLVGLIALADIAQIDASQSGATLNGVTRPGGPNA